MILTTFFTLFFGLFSLPLCLAQDAIPLRELPSNFTLAAVNTTLPNSNATGVPLVLGQDGSTSGITFHVTSTYASYPYNDYPTLALIDGALRAYRANGEWSTNATSVKSGGTMGWMTTYRYVSPAAQDYTVLKSPAYEHPILAAHGKADLWSLCPFPAYRYQTTIVYNVSANIPAPPYLPYDPSTCYPVTINVISV
ncbi:hypothetical protein BDQ17DRAFT_1243135 [Cyathus striatus]|nr:hypothetical protein BDQ17DRAFT_1243135 [Cyathus striatus]